MVLASLCFKYANRCQKLYMESKNNGVNTSPVEWNLFTLTSAHVPLRSSLKETF